MHTVFIFIYILHVNKLIIFYDIIYNAVVTFEGLTVSAIALKMQITLSHFN